MNLNDTSPTGFYAFREVSAIMAAPWTEEELEELMHREPLNSVAQLPADEELFPLDEPQ